MAEVSQLKDFAFLLTAVVTVIGWGVVSNQNDRRERRRDIREHITDLEERAIKLHELASKYWLTASASERPACSAALKAEVQAFGRLLRLIQAAGMALDVEQTAEWVADLRSFATGGNFEVKGRRKSKDDAVRVQNVGETLEIILEDVNELYYQKYPVGRTNFKWSILALPLMTSGDRS